MCNFLLIFQTFSDIKPLLGYRQILKLKTKSRIYFKNVITQTYFYKKVIYYSKSMSQFKIKDCVTERRFLQLKYDDIKIISLK